MSYDLRLLLRNLTDKFISTGVWRVDATTVHSFYVVRRPYNHVTDKNLYHP
jgi:hypothetical protein